MPFSGFKNFKSCVESQKKKGKSDESAKKICGFLEKKSKGELTQKDLDGIKGEIPDSEITLAKASVWFGVVLHGE